MRHSIYMPVVQLSNHNLKLIRLENLRIYPPWSPFSKWFVSPSKMCSFEVTRYHHNGQTPSALFSVTTRKWSLPAKDKPHIPSTARLIIANKARTEIHPKVKEIVRNNRTPTQGFGVSQVPGYLGGSAGTFAFLSSWPSSISWEGEGGCWSCEPHRQTMQPASSRGTKTIPNNIAITTSQPHSDFRTPIAVRCPW